LDDAEEQEAAASDRDDLETSSSALEHLPEGRERFLERIAVERHSCTLTSCIEHVKRSILT
jgi:hypothetical protein